MAELEHGLDAVDSAASAARPAAATARSSSSVRRVALAFAAILFDELIHERAELAARHLARIQAAHRARPQRSGDWRTSGSSLSSRSRLMRSNYARGR